MNQRYDLLAISLLFFTAIIAIWFALAGIPDLSAVQEWQTLMASLIALFGAFKVFTGAKLAYTAAMAKIELDRELHAREAARITLGVCLRLEFSLRELLLQVRNQLLRVPANRGRDVIVRIDDFDLAMQSKLDEAWANLDRFPRRLSQEISDIRGSYFDYKEMIRINPGAEWRYGFVTPEPEETIQLREILKGMEKHCVSAIARVRELAGSLSASN